MRMLRRNPGACGSGEVRRGKVNRVNKVYRVTK
jgi:hypothetical protein